MVKCSTTNGSQVQCRPKMERVAQRDCPISRKLLQRTTYVALRAGAVKRLWQSGSRHLGVDNDNDNQPVQTLRLQSPLRSSACTLISASNVAESRRGAWNYALIRSHPLRESSMDPMGRTGAPDDRKGSKDERKPPMYGPPPPIAEIRGREPPPNQRGVGKQPRLDLSLIQLDWQ